MSFRAVIAVAELGADIGLNNLDDLVPVAEVSIVAKYCRNPDDSPADRAYPVPRHSMHVDPADTEQVVPGGRAMAKEAPLYARIAAAHHQLHLDVAHKVRRRRNVALSAIGRAWGRVAKLRQRPFCQRMAARASCSERAAMAVLCRMA